MNKRGDRNASPDEKNVSSTSLTILRSFLSTANKRGKAIFNTQCNFFFFDVQAKPKQQSEKRGYPFVV